jgi:hypothetical protein
MEAKTYDAALAMQFIELDTWAFLTRPASNIRHNRSSFMHFVRRYLQDAPGHDYAYRAEDVYAARCALLHTFGALANMHAENKSVVIWRYHMGKQNTFIPGLTRMAYISVCRFIQDAQAALATCLTEVMENQELGKLFGERLPSVYLHAGILPDRDPEAIVAMDPEVDAAIAVLDGTVDSDEVIFLAGHTMVRGVCQG